MPMASMNTKGMNMTDNMPILLKNIRFFIFCSPRLLINIIRTDKSGVKKIRNCRNLPEIRGKNPRRYNTPKINVKTGGENRNKCHQNPFAAPVRNRAKRGRAIEINNPPINAQILLNEIIVLYINSETTGLMTFPYRNMRISIRNEPRPAIAAANQIDAW